MIKFFRKIRKQLLKESRLSKYVLYAIGEIILVVIGILIALQINNWNESQKTRTTEKIYLEALQEEFQFNRNDLRRVMDRNEKNIESSVKLSTYIGSSGQVTESDFASSFVEAFGAEIQYRPVQGVLEEIISSGKLEILSSTELRFALSSWSGVIGKVRFQEQELSNWRLDIWDMFKSQGNLRKTVYNSWGEIYGIKGSGFEEGSIHLLESQKFDNLLVGFIITSEFTNEQYYTDLGKQIDDILALIKKELQSG